MDKEIDYDRTFGLGDQTEEHFAKIMLKDYANVKVTGGNFPEYDIIADDSEGNTITWEIKTSTGVSEIHHNFVEYYQSNSEGGMPKSEAKWWVFYGDDGNIYQCDRIELNQLCKDKYSFTKRWSVTSYDNGYGTVSAKGIAIHKSKFKVIGKHNLVLV